MSGERWFRPGRIMRDRGLAAVMAAFLISRLAAYAAGVRFDDSTLTYFLQYLDPALLKTRLLESIWYLHSQPPLFNLLLGGVLKIAPEGYGTLLASLWLAIGLAMAAGLYRLQRRLGVPERAAAVAAILFAASPSALLFENWLFYTYPETLLILLGALFLHRYLSQGRPLDGAMLMLAAGSLVLTRSLFHLVWLAAAAALPIATGTVPRRRTVLLAIPVLLIVTGWYAKNGALFGGFSASSWLGMSVAKMTTFQLDEQERMQMADSGELTGTARVEPFSDLAAYGFVLDDTSMTPGGSIGPPPTGVPALDERTRPGGASNYNHVLVPLISSMYMRDALHVLARRPATFAKASAAAYYYYLFPSSIYWFLDRNRSRIRWYDRIYNAVVYLQPAYHEPSSPEPSARELRARRILKVAPVLILGVPIVILAGLALAWRLLRSGRWRSADGATMLYIAGTILYVTLLGNALEINENYRFRFTIDPLLLTIGMVVGTEIVKRIENAEGRMRKSSTDKDRGTGGDAGG